MTTAAAHKRWLRKMARETDRMRLLRARAAVKEAREGKRTARARAREVCAAARVAFKEWLGRERERIAVAIAKLREDLKTETQRRRAKVQACCGKGERDRVRASSDARIAAARQQLAALLEERKREATWTKPKRVDPPRRERREESDHSVAVNLTPDQLIVWEKVKARIRGTDRMTRTEAFQHWLHDHSADAARILAEDAERAYRDAIRAEARERAALRKPRNDAQLAQSVTQELAHAVGFENASPRASVAPARLSSVPPPSPTSKRSIAPPAAASGSMVVGRQYSRDNKGTAVRVGDTVTLQRDQLNAKGQRISSGFDVEVWHLHPDRDELDVRDKDGRIFRVYPNAVTAARVRPRATRKPKAPLMSQLSGTERHEDERSDTEITWDARQLDGRFRMGRDTWPLGSNGSELYLMSPKNSAERWSTKLGTIKKLTLEAASKAASKALAKRGAAAPF